LCIFRNHLCKALFYKFVLFSAGSLVLPKLRSGAEEIKREVSKGQQNYDTDPDLYPINKPIRKLESAAQCTGEAEFIDDIPKVRKSYSHVSYPVQHFLNLIFPQKLQSPGELTAVFVLSTVANCEIVSVDVDAAKVVEGFVEWVDHNDIPGINNASSGRFQEEIFLSKKVRFVTIKQVWELA
jgi:xanthine dehydrogenase/oxidase